MPGMPKWRRHASQSKGTNTGKLEGVRRFLNGGAASFVADRDCVAYVFAWGGGAGGFSDGAPTPTGTGGNAGGACMKRVTLAKGQAISWSIGTGGAFAVGSTPGQGSDTVVTFPDGTTMTAQRGGLSSGSAGTGVGGDLNRRGGKGGSNGSSIAPENGDTDGSGPSSTGVVSDNGGGAAGFSEFGELFLTLNLVSNLITAFSAGGQGSSVTRAGGDGLVLLALLY